MGNVRRFVSREVCQVNGIMAGSHNRIAAMENLRRSFWGMIMLKATI
jgi:hypothetical protein